ncbi:MAG: cytochrome P450 [Pseudomonadota bacterium]
MPARVDCDPRHPDFYRQPYVHYTRWHADHPVFFWEQYGMWCFARFADVNALLRDARFGRQITHKLSREQLGWAPRPQRLCAFDAVEAHSLLNLEPPAHTAMRALVTKAFVGRRVERMRDDIVALVRGRLDAMAPSGSADLIASLAMPVPAEVIAAMVGVPGEHVPDLLRWSHAMVKVYTLQQSEDDDRAANAAATAFSRFVHERIAAKRRQPGDDLLSHLIAVRTDGTALSDAEIVSTVVLLLNAGHEASVHLTGNAVHTLLGEGHDTAVLFADTARTRATANEVMRHCTPLHLFTRYALEDVELASGVSVRQGEEIGLLLGAANRDPVRFERPDRFDPDRPDAGHVALGAGIHHCLGAVLAKMELEIVLSELFRRLPGLQLDGVPVVRDSYHFHGLEALHVQW